MRNPIPYPLRAARISFCINPFGFWWKPQYGHFKNMPELFREAGETIWWVRWLWFQISYSRWR